MALRPLSLAAKDIKTQNSAKRRQELRDNGHENRLDDSEDDEPGTGDEVAVRLGLAPAALDDLVRGREIQREGADARDHHQHADDDVVEGLLRQHRQDVACDALCGESGGRNPLGEPTKRRRKQRPMMA